MSTPTATTACPLRMEDPRLDAPCDRGGIATRPDSDDESIYIQRQYGRHLMKSEPRKISVLGIGATGSEYIPQMYFDGVGGLFDHERAGQERLRLTNGRHARDVSPTRAQVRQAATGKSSAEAQEQNIRNLFERAGNAEIFKKVPAGELIVACDDPRQVMGSARAYARRHKLQRLLALTPGDGSHSRACPVLAASGKDNPFSAAWHVDASSPFAETQSRRRQAAFVVNAVNALSMAPASYPHNPTLGEVIEGLGEEGPCFHAGFASAAVTSNGSAFWAGAKRLVAGRYTRANAPLNDALAQAARATEAALERGTQTTFEPISPDRVTYVLYIVPIETKGETFDEFVERTSVWLTRNVPTAKAIFVSGPGVRSIDDEGERFLQVMALSTMGKPTGMGK